MRHLLIILAITGLFAANVILDPGHGGTDSGATGPSYYEKNANLDVGLYARDYLTGVGVSVGMTRSTDATLTLADRTTIANSGGWERFMSIHENAFDASVQGTETYCHPTADSESIDLRNRVQPQLIWAHGYYNRGTKTGDYYVLRNTTMPAILGEGTFIDYTAGWDESARYATNWEDHEGRQGFAYANGYCLHRGITAPVYGEDPDPGGDSDSIIVDNIDPEFSVGGSWSTGTYSGGWDGSYRWASVTGTNWAMWNPNLPDAGEYDVYMWWLAGSNRCNDVFVRIMSTANDSLWVAQTGSGGTWHYLGAYTFDAGTAGYVSLSDRDATGGDVVIADAVLWIHRGAMGMESTAMPEKLQIKIGPNPFNTTLGISWQGKDQVDMDIFDTRGKRVATFNDLPEKGAMLWDAQSLPSGIYLVNVRSGEELLTERLVLLK